MTIQNVFPVSECFRSKCSRNDKLIIQSTADVQDITFPLTSNGAGSFLPHRRTQILVDERTAIQNCEWAGESADERTGGCGDLCMGGRKELPAVGRDDERRASLPPSGLDEGRGAGADAPSFFFVSVFTLRTISRLSNAAQCSS